MKTTAADSKSLSWYLTRSNHGRGRLSAESKRFIKMGWLSLVWTGHYDWTLSLTDKGRSLMTTDTCDAR